jgi:ATP synthase protein I
MLGGVKGRIIGISVGLGGSVYVFSTFFFAYRALSLTSAVAAKKMVQNFYQGELLKWGVSLVLLSVILSFTTIEPIYFLGAYFLTQIIALLFWLIGLNEK